MKNFQKYMITLSTFVATAVNICDCFKTILILKMTLLKLFCFNLSALNMSWVHNSIIGADKTHFVVFSVK